MDRKDFLITLYKKYIKPVFFLGISISFSVFLWNTWNNTQVEGSLLIFILYFFGVILFFGLIRYLLESIYDSFSPNTKSFLGQMNKAIKYLSIPLALYFLFYIWNENKVRIIVVLIIYLIANFPEILKSIKSIKSK
ncbi:hypothetical protein [Flavobacterium sp. GCM10027622]|uniref:hypothetical protein n=1 Tax=unclassified Flavobacterium TaxID=196869 RepID=UPI00360D310B